MKKIVLGALFGLLPFKVFANPACVVCTVAIGASLSVARKLGVDDCVVGVWAGAMLSILGYWTIRFFEKRKWNWPMRNHMLMAMSVAMIGFAYISAVKYHPVSICGMFVMDPVLFGTICGALLFILVSKLYEWMKKKNGGHAHFPFEKVILPIVALLLASWAMVICM